MLFKNVKLFLVREYPRRSMERLLVFILVPAALCSHTVSGFENVAVGKPAYQSSLYAAEGVPEHAVDGNTDSNWSGQSCTHTLQEQNSWWKVDLQDIHTVDNVVITNRQDCCSERLVGAVVRVGSSSDIETIPKCGDPISSDQVTASTTITIDCNAGTRGRYVIVQLEGQNQYLTLCEVEVYGALLSENVAAGKSASQSSLYTISTPAGPENAIDGNADSDWSSQSCTHTLQEENSWWKVDLQGTYKVDVIVITNRKDCCSERLVGAVVRVGSSEDIASNTQCGDTVTSEAVQGSTTLAFVCSGCPTGRYVSVQLEEKNEFLTLCEVEVYGSLAAENVAVGKPASQSSLYTISTPAGPENAVDGNADSNWSSQSCTHTLQEQDSWWKVDLQDTYNVDEVVIINREDCCSERLVGAVVRVGPSEDIASNTQCGNAVTSEQITASLTITFDCADETAGRYASVQLEGQNQFLTLCEVEVYGTLSTLSPTQPKTEAPPPKTEAPPPKTEAPPPKTEAPVIGRISFALFIMKNKGFS
ncbi:uncharacterized protein [Ptychodera flava]|uniref:uncharacterized protein n=1 Tax=Ptychodera flava TaxID=63121 RepID=UPI00396A3697